MKPSTEKFCKACAGTPYALLPQATRVFIKNRSLALRLTHQSIRNLIIMARDLEMWGARPLTEIMNCDETNRSRAMAQATNEWERLKTAGRDYDGFNPGFKKPRIARSVRKSSIPAGDRILGPCPVSSPRTRCCNLLTLDTARGCLHKCSYCSVQDFFKAPAKRGIQIEKNLRQKLDALALDPDAVHHIGTGQSSDSLMLENRFGELEALVDFARKNPNVILELKTKSAAVEPLLALHPPRNIICTWTLSAPSIIRCEEHLAASLDERLTAAEKAAGAGLLVGFHFHPMFPFAGWEREYSGICNRLVESFNPGQIAMVSFGALTFARSLPARIRELPYKSKILQMPLTECAGKISFPAGDKVKLFSTAYAALLPWHGRVFFYLCMEPHELWHASIGHEFRSNEDFERAMKTSYIEKILGR
ncbi:MAG: hypothetical protein A2583_11665 [Bdellovibrionales bacterium RIFOXYD1_FULL_53_11]|nr:MAG: hypothetical protein A2583_11665 [Bdellovibrionales bacterium RIFOXYD1_FULL_53_11]